MNATQQSKADPATINQPVTLEESRTLARIIELYPKLTRWQKTEINWTLYGMILKTFFSGPTKALAVSVVVCFWHLIVPDLVLYGLPVLFVVVWFYTLSRIF